MKPAPYCMNKKNPLPQHSGKGSKSDIFDYP